MGIPALWELFKSTTPSVGEVKSLAELSTSYFAKHGRPMRIAIDEAGWRFKNLTDAQVAFIRTKEPRANPIEKAIMWRLLRLMKLNIQVIFVLDGPGRPWKRGGPSGRVDYERTRLLIQLLDRLRIPHHRAPAEAEAECARMERLGIVDAVWSDDADSLMFGCKILIRDHRPTDAKKSDNKKDIKYVEVFRAEAVQERLGLSQAGILMFVLLVGGDYDTHGLEGCGPVAALEACRHNEGQLAERLWNTPVHKRDLAGWADSLSEYFMLSSSRRMAVPAGFPRDLVFKNYRNPKVSSDNDFHNLNGLRRGWNLPIDESKLQTFFRERFNIWTKGYLKHVLPALLVRTLRDVESGQEQSSSKYAINIIPRRGQAAQEAHLESKIVFDHKHVTKLNLITEPVEFEDWSLLKGEKGAAFDPTLPVEMEILDYILAKGLGHAAVDDLREQAARPLPRKRKAASADDEASDDEQSASKKKLKKARGKASVTPTAGETPPAKATRKKKTADPSTKTTADLEAANMTPPVSTRPVFRRPTVPISLSPSSSQGENSALSSHTPTSSNHSHSSIRALSALLPPLSDDEADGEDDDMTLMPYTAEMPDDDEFDDETAEAIRLSLLEDTESQSSQQQLVSSQGPASEDEDDPDFAEAIRLSLLASSPSQVAITTEATVPETGPQILDRQAMARARLAYFAKPKIGSLADDSRFPPEVATALNKGVLCGKDVQPIIIDLTDD